MENLMPPLSSLSTVIDVQFARECDYNALVKRIKKLSAVISVSGSPYKEDPFWRRVTIHSERRDWDAWLYQTKINGLKGYGVSDTIKHTYQSG